MDWMQQNPICNFMSHLFVCSIGCKCDFNASAHDDSYFVCCLVCDLIVSVCASCLWYESHIAKILPAKMQIPFEFGFGFSSLPHLFISFVAFIRCFTFLYVYAISFVWMHNLNFVNRRVYLSLCASCNIEKYFSYFSMYFALCVDFVNKIVCYWVNFFAFTSALNPEWTGWLMRCVLLYLFR